MYRQLVEMHRGLLFDTCLFPFYLIINHALDKYFRTQERKDFEAYDKVRQYIINAM